MKQVKTSGKMSMVNRTMSIFLWGKIFRTILALPPKKFYPVQGTPALILAQDELWPLRTTFGIF